MRISTSQLFNDSIRTIVDQQSALSKVSQQISAERRVLTPADDPVAASREISLNASLGVSNQLIKNQQNAESQLEQNENYLDSAKNALQAVQSKLVQAGGGTLNDDDRKTLAADLTSLRAQLMGVANSQDANGNYVFAGFKSDTQPFVDTANGVAYEGDNGVRQSQIGVNRMVDTSFSGAYLFGDVPTGKSGLDVSAGAGNTGSATLSSSSITDRAAWSAASAAGPYTIEFGADGAYSVADATGAQVSTGSVDDSGSVQVAGTSVTFAGTPASGDTMTVGASGSQSIFDTLDQAISALSNPDSPQESVQLANALYNAGNNVDQGLNRILEAVTSIGSRINDIDASTDSETARGDSIQGDISTTVGSDPSSLTELAGELAQRTFTVQAAQLTYTQISQLSIFNYLK